MTYSFNSEEAKPMNASMREQVDIVAATPLEGTFALLKFSDGVELVVNLRRFMRGPIFDEVFTNGLFSKVAVDHDAGTIVWPNGADLDPEVLRYASDDIYMNADFPSRLRDIKTTLDKVQRARGTLSRLRPTGSIHLKHRVLKIETKINCRLNFYVDPVDTSPLTTSVSIIVNSHIVDSGLLGNIDMQQPRVFS